MIKIIQSYLTLCKPRVVMLMILTSIVGMCLAPSPTVPWRALTLGNLGIALVASAAAALNQLADQHLDRIMHRTQHRPLVQGTLTASQTLIFALCLGALGTFILAYFINTLTAVLTFLALVGYAIVYTIFLKQATPQNIVIGGIAGAAPPLLGWTAVTGSINPAALVLVLIIYVWTPPHFWALAIYRLEDYKKANVPMLPHTHGVPYTKLNILLYTILLICVSILPFGIGMSGWVYLIGILVADAIFLYHVIKLFRSEHLPQALRTFHYSIHYLSVLFILLLLDHYC